MECQTCKHTRLQETPHMAWKLQECGLAKHKRHRVVLCNGEREKKRSLGGKTMLGDACKMRENRPWVECKGCAICACMYSTAVYPIWIQMLMHLLGSPRMQTELRDRRLYDASQAECDIFQARFLALVNKLELPPHFLVRCYSHSSANTLLPP